MRQTKSTVGSAVTVVSATLAGAVSLFRLLPELEKRGLDSTETILGAFTLAFLAIGWALVAGTPAWFIGRKLGRREYGEGTRKTSRASLMLGGGLVAGFYVIAIALNLIIGRSSDDVETQLGISIAVEIRPLIYWYCGLAVIWCVAIGYRIAWLREKYRYEREQQCPYCKDWVHLEATKCRNCLSRLLPNQNVSSELGSKKRR
jgi:hypothetical protein